MYKVLRPFSYYTALGIAEVVVLIIEILVYTIKFENKKKAFFYAVIVNLISIFLGGGILTQIS